MIWNENLFRQTDPFSGLRQIQREMDRMFNGYAPAVTRYPVLNAWGDEHELTVEAELPGVDPADVNVTVEDGVLHLSGERKPVDIDGETASHLAEISYGTFDRGVRLPYEVEVDKVQARYTNGVLRITLPRAEAAKPQRIEVRS